MKARLFLALLAACVFGAMAQAGEEAKGIMFKDDLKFLQEHTQIVVLSDASGDAKVAVAPAYQGRVMTSSAAGDDGLSFGWINRDLIASGKTLQHFNPLGGEERFWLGPEGGQFSIFFAKGAPFDLDHWFVPPAIDTEPFDLVASDSGHAAFKKQVHLVNYSGTAFDLEVNRDVRLLSAERAWKDLGVAPAPAVKLVAYETESKITNKGENAWKKETGLLSIWILGMYNPSPATTIVIPFVAGPEAERGAIVNDAYFGKVPPDRLKIKDGLIFFSGDGKHRSKIGLSPKRCKPVAGSYDAANKVLTLVQFTRPEGAADYVNSMWKMQDNPYAGDVVNSYNDGPTSPGGKPLGPFYEIESSSPAAALAPGESLTHVHRTLHLQGDEAALDPIARAALGVGLEEIKNGLK
jgi:hypothetical protein